MSYGRNPHYIYNNGEDTVFEAIHKVPNVLLNAFLYKILLTNRRDELKERLRLGKKEWMYMIRLELLPDGMSYEIVSDPMNDPELARQIEWINSHEDDVVKYLMGEGDIPGLSRLGTDSDGEDRCDRK